MTTINLEEKLTVAKELKLEKQISLLQYRKGMFDLKFKQITFEQIQSRLKFARFRLSHFIFSCCGFLISFSPFIVVIVGIYKECSANTVFWTLLTLSGLLIICSAHFSIQRTRVKNCWVNDFKEEIPFGGLLALKEASEKDIVAHRVWFPVWDTERHSDPIITGVAPNGDWVEIYAWNENDVYESN